MKIVGYIRVSTDQQAESGLGLEAQKVQLSMIMQKNMVLITMKFLAMKD